MSFLDSLLGSNTIQVNPSNPQQTPSATPPPRFNTANISNAIIGHESRGSVSPTQTVNPITKATGISQITPAMFSQWRSQYASSQNKNVTFQQLATNPQLQQQVTNESITGLLNKYKNGLSNWPTSTQALQKSKQEIMQKYNHPVYWAAGEWVAGPNWVAKLGNKTAPGAKETVRDYLNAVGNRYFGK